MGMHVQAMAAGALPASALGRGRVAQPGGGQRQRQLELPQAGGALQQPGVAGAGQQLGGLAGNPRGQMDRRHGQSFQKKERI